MILLPSGFCVLSIEVLDVKTNDPATGTLEKGCLDRYIFLLFDESHLLINVLVCSIIFPFYILLL
jgi:hypothetical protein